MTEGRQVARFDRYLLSQLLVLFGFFSLILVLIYWVNRAVVLFDQLIADGQSASVFFEFTALSLPGLIRLVLPVSAFAAAVYVTNKLSSDSELTVMQATGFSPWRIARPVAMFGLFVAVVMNILTHILVPASLSQLAQREAEIADNVTQRMLVEGRFLSPAPGITFYIRDITPEGELRDVFLNDARRPDRRLTYTADRAFLVRLDQGPQLVMFDGMAQTLNAENQLATTTFSDFSYNLADMMTGGAQAKTNLRHLPTSVLLTADNALSQRMGAPVGRLLQEGHGRITQALLSLVAPLIGFATLLAGRFSRFGLWRQVLLAIFFLVLIKLIEGATSDIVRRNADQWLLIYAPVVVGTVISGALLWWAGRDWRVPPLQKAVS